MAITEANGNRDAGETRWALGLDDTVRPDDANLAATGPAQEEAVGLLHGLERDGRAEMAGDATRHVGERRDPPFEHRGCQSLVPYFCGATPPRTHAG